MARRPNRRTPPEVFTPLPEGMGAITSMIQVTPTKVLVATANALYKFDPTKDEPVVEPVKLKF